jgi:heme/copper-type cytochrome/quinol oxidase subunit 4
MQSNPSPKGKYRMWGVLLMGVLLSLLAFLLDPEQALGWLMTTVMSLGKAVLASGAFYLVLRRFSHMRTHEVPEADKVKWHMVMFVGVAIVFGLALIP